MWRNVVYFATSTELLFAGRLNARPLIHLRKKNTALIQRNVQTRPFYIAHLRNDRSRLSHHNTPTRRSGRRTHLWLFLWHRGCILRAFFILRVCSASVFLSLPPSVLSSPLLTGARALDHGYERTIGSRRATWLLNHGSAHRVRFAITRTEQYCKGYTVKTSDCLLDRKYRLRLFPYHLFFSFIFMERDKYTLRPKSLYCPLLAGCN